MLEVRAPEELRSTPRRLSAALVRRAWLGSPPFVMASCVISICLIVGAFALAVVDGDFDARLRLYLIVVGLLSPLLLYAAARSLVVIHELKFVRNGKVALARLTNVRIETLPSEGKDLEVNKYSVTFVAENGKAYERTFEDSYAQNLKASVEQSVEGKPDDDALERVLIFYSAEDPNDNIAINELGMWGGGGCFVPGSGLTVRYPRSPVVYLEVGLMLFSILSFVVAIASALHNGQPLPLR